jgi:hypothetical protein
VVRAVQLLMRSVIADRRLAQVFLQRKEFAQSRQADNMGQLGLSPMQFFIRSSGCGNIYCGRRIKPVMASDLTRRAASTVAFSMLATSMKK